MIESHRVFSVKRFCHFLQSNVPETSKDLNFSVWLSVVDYCQGNMLSQYNAYLCVVHVFVCELRTMKFKFLNKAQDKNAEHIIRLSNKKVFLLFLLDSKKKYTMVNKST